MKDTTRILIVILVMIGIMSIIILLPICHIATKIDTITATPETVTEATNTPEEYTDTAEHEINGYEALELNFTLDMEDYKIYNPDELTPEILENRMDGDKVIIERVIGKVTDKRSGAGKIINTADTYYNYISYSNVDFHIEDGTIILTYLIYNPESNGVDDISDRFDFVLDREWED